MSLHAISVFDKVYKSSPENIAPSLKHLMVLQRVKIDKWQDLSTPFSP